MNDWAIESFGSEHYKRGIDALSSNTCVDLCKTKIKPHHEEHLVSKESVVSDTSDNEEKKSKKYWKNFHQNTKNTVTERQLTQDDYLSIKVQNEVSLFRNLIVSEKMHDEDCTSTRRFWLKNQSTLPNLYKLAKKLLNIQASTAFVERYFSICGIICTTKNTNMNDKTLVMRSVLKSNMNILDELNIEED